MDRSSFSVYDVTISYPRGWKVDFKHGSSFKHGGFDILEPDGRAIVTVLLRSTEQSMGIVKGETKRGLLSFLSKPTIKEIYVDPLHSIYIGVLWYRLKGSAKNVKLLISKEVKINNHRGIFRKNFSSRR